MTQIRKAYHPPKLTVYGPIEKITQRGRQGPPRKDAGSADGRGGGPRKRPDSRDGMSGRGGGWS